MYLYFVYEAQSSIWDRFNIKSEDWKFVRPVKDIEPQDITNRIIEYGTIHLADVSKFHWSGTLLPVIDVVAQRWTFSNSFDKQALSGQYSQRKVERRSVRDAGLIAGTIR
jgi:hypothetical protein